MKIRPLKKTDDTGAVAALIYETDRSLFSFLFGKREKALLVLKALVELDNNSFSHRHIYCAVEDGLDGILITFGHGDVDKRLDGKDYEKVLSLVPLIILGIKSFFIKALFPDQKKGELYIQNLSVASAQQGKGIGSLLIDFAFKRAAERGCACLTLDVAGDNPGARRLYERKGFLSQEKHGFFSFSTFFMKAPLEK